MFIFRNKKNLSAVFSALILAISVAIISGSNSFAASCPTTQGPPNAYCGDVAGVTVDTMGWGRVDEYGLAENKINVDAGKINLENAEVTFSNSNLRLVNITSYTHDEAVARFDSERSTAYSFLHTNVKGKSIVISETLLKNIQKASAPPRKYSIGNTSATLKWTGAAKTQSGTVLDVEMKIDNISVYLSGRRYYPIEIFRGSWHYATNALQEHSLSELSDRGDYYQMTSMDGYYDSASYDVTIKLYKTGTSTLVDNDESAMAMSFEDIDARDLTNSDTSTGWGYWNAEPNLANPYSGGITLNPDRSGSPIYRHFDQSGVPKEYAESVTILNGLKQNKVFSYNTNNETAGTTHDENGTYLYFTEKDGNLRVTGVRATGADGEPSANTSRFLILADARGFKYRWTGSECGTKLGFIGTKTVETSVTGTYADKATITETDDKVTWRENKVIEIRVKSGYKLTSLKLDGVNVLNDAVEDNNVWTYTLNDVVDDHEIVAQVSPYVFEICKVNLNGDYLEGAVLRLSGIDEDLKAIIFESINWRYIDNVSDDNENIEWATRSNSCSQLRGLQDGTYTLSELVAPDDYDLANDITFVISNGRIIEASSQSGDVDYTATSVTMVDENLPAFGSLRIEKAIKGTGADANKAFSIMLTITDMWSDYIDPVNNRNYIEYEICKTSNNSCSGNYRLDFGNSASASFTLKDGEYIEIPISKNYSYRIDEADYSSDGYSTTYSSGRTGTIIGGSQKTATITNTKNLSPDTGFSFSPNMLPFIIAGMTLPAGLLYLLKGIKKAN